MSLLTKLKNRSKWLWSYPVYWYYRLIFQPPEIRSIEQTIERILDTRASISRYGDGELDIMVGRSIPFQTYHPLLAQKMQDILLLDDDNFLVGLNDTIVSFDNITRESRHYWKNNLRKNLKHYVRLLKKDKVYYNACITRPYMRYTDKSKADSYFSELKKIWQDRDVVFVEGEKSRLGMGNDLYAGAKSIRRILCPAKNAFDHYDEIMDAVKSTCGKDALILIALGPTATAMAYDLYKMGYQAIDTGHIDIEYEWFLMGATEKVPIKSKYTNEAIGGAYTDDTAVDAHYQEQIIGRVGI